MSDFAATWELTRGRFDDAVRGLNRAQLNWRMQPDALTLGEMAIHVAGVEVSFISQLLGRDSDGFEARVRKAATDSIVNEDPFPFTPDEITPELVDEALRLGRDLVAPVIANPDSIREREIKSVLGPIVDGTGTLARLAYHPGYHQGQAHLVKTAPGFPA